MKKSLMVIGLGSLLFAGCVQREVVYRDRPRAAVVQTAPPPSENIYVANEAPPPAQTEVVIAAPGPGYVWTRGYWEWHGRWVWVGGRWVVGPHPHAVWVDGRWTHRRGHYVWVRGYWR